MEDLRTMAFLISKKKFIQSIENNEGCLNNKELADSMGISESYFYDLRKKYKAKIKDIAAEMVQAIAVEQIHNLARNARKCDTQAAKILLEIAGVYIPSSKQKIELPDKTCGVIALPEKKPVGAPVSYLIDNEGHKLNE